MTGTPDKDRANTALKMTLAGVIGQVGCLTLAIIAVALFAGLWLDNQFHTRPIFTLVLVIASVPLTIYLMFRIVLSVAPKIQVNTEKLVSSTKKEEEEPEVGEQPGNQNPT
jgi:F0F1-type ATP synthase assembly protein I